MRRKLHALIKTMRYIFHLHESCRCQETPQPISTTAFRFVASSIFRGSFSELSPLHLLALLSLHSTAVGSSAKI